MTRPSSGAQASTVQRPSTAREGRTSGSYLRLADAGQVFAVHEQPQSSELQLTKQADDDVGARLGPIRVCFELLSAGEVDLHAEPTFVLRLDHAN